MKFHRAALGRAALGVVLGAAAWVAVGTAVASAAPAHHPAVHQPPLQTLTVLSYQESATMPTASSFTSDMVLEANRALVGTLDATCTITNPTVPTGTCVGTFDFNKLGSITVDASITSTGGTITKVSGGTGRFAGAYDGSGHFTNLDPNGLLSVNVLHFRLPRGHVVPSRFVPTTARVPVPRHSLVAVTYLESASQPTPLSFSFTADIVRHFKVVGTLAVTCTYPSTSPTAVGTCDGTFTFPGKGTISGVVMVPPGNGPDTGKITSGTGIFKGVHGKITVNNLDQPNNNIEVDVLQLHR